MRLNEYTDNEYNLIEIRSTQLKQLIRAFQKYWLDRNFAEPEKYPLHLVQDEWDARLEEYSKMVPD